MAKRIREPGIAQSVANRIRLRRVALGLSQQNVADAVGLTFQQIQKYEGTANRITVDALYRIAAALDIGVPELLDGVKLGADTPQPIPRDIAGLEHAKAFRALPAHLRAAATETVKAMGRAA